MSASPATETTIIAGTMRRAGTDVARFGAQFVSLAASPPVLALAGLAMLAVADRSRLALAAAAAIGLGGVMLPLALVVAQLSRGRVRDLELTTRGERLGPLLLTCAGLGTSVAAVQIFGAPQSIVGFGCILGVQSFVTLMITMRWKVSVHCLAAATFGVLIWVVHDDLRPLLILVPFMIWSRLYLQRHTAAQTVAGSLLGVVSVVTLWPLLVG